MKGLTAMNKIEFLTRLKNSLEKNGLSKEDTDDALNYYEEIFMDAGFGKDAETAESLGSPEMVAEGILRENGIEINRNDGFTNSTNIQQNIPVQKKSSSDTALKIILLVISFPIWLPLVITVCAFIRIFRCNNGSRFCFCSFKHSCACFGYSDFI